MKDYFLEAYYFFIKNLKATFFGTSLLFIILLSHYIKISFLSKYDFIFISAILIQIFLLISKMETIKEFKVIILFHLLATIMELFKTSPTIASWSYPDLENTFFVLGTVPLFTGFLYSAVGSYISRAMDLLELKYINYPDKKYTIFLAVLIYLNFFTHHFIPDFRYFIFIGILFLFWKTKVEFRVYKKTWKINFILSGFLTAFFIWLAENFATYFKVWVYPNQVNEFHMVSLEKIGSWFLLLIISFILVYWVKDTEKNKKLKK